MPIRSNYAFLASKDSKIIDSKKLWFGTGAGIRANDGDISFAGDGTDFDILQATTNSSIKLGVSGAGIDLQLYGDTVAADLLWDQSADSLIFGDSGKLVFGTGSDLMLPWHGADFDVTQATTNSSIKWGVSGAGIDHVFYGDTATADMTWDQSADTLLFNDNAKVVFGHGSSLVHGHRQREDLDRPERGRTATYRRCDARRVPCPHDHGGRRDGSHCRSIRRVLLRDRRGDVHLADRGDGRADLPFRQPDRREHGDHVTDRCECLQKRHLYDRHIPDHERADRRGGDGVLQRHELVPARPLPAILRRRRDGIVAMKMTLEQAYEQREQLRQRLQQLAAATEETRAKLNWIEGHIAALTPDEDTVTDEEPTPLRAADRS